jgi:hypothetical protein
LSPSETRSFQGDIDIGGPSLEKLLKTLQESGAEFSTVAAAAYDT